MPVVGSPAALRLLEEIERAGADVAAGRVRLPPRSIERLGPRTDLFLMSAFGPDLAVVKLLAIGPCAGADSGRLTLFTPEGSRLGDAAAGPATAQRTAAVSFAAVRRLRGHVPEPVAVIGAGSQARAHLALLAAIAPGARVAVVARTAEHAESAAAGARERGLQAERGDDAGGSIRGAALVITATSSRSPVIPDVVRDDAVVIAVGNYRADASELPTSLVRRSRVYVDAAAGARLEAGELLGAGIDWSNVQSLDDGSRWTPDTSRPAVVKSVGSAAWDLAWARAALDA